MKRLVLLILPVLLALAACDSGGSGGVSLAEYESDLGEAVVRHLIKNLPDPAPGVPRAYCVVKGPYLETTRTDFASRFADLKLRFISGNVLKVTEPDHAVVDPETGLAPYVLQITDIKESGVSKWTVDVGWSYKKLFERHRYEVSLNQNKHEVTSSTRLEGNYQPGS